MCVCVCVCAHTLYWTSIRPILSMHVNEWVKFQAQGFVGDTRVRSGQDYVNNSTPTTRSLFRLPTACLRQISRSDRHNKQTGWEVQKHIQTWINTHAQTHINKQWFAYSQIPFKRQKKWNELSHIDFLCQPPKHKHIPTYTCRNTSSELLESNKSGKGQRWWSAKNVSIWSNVSVPNNII